MRILFYALVIVTPLLMYSSTSELFEFNKILFIYIITALVAMSWTISMVLYKPKLIQNQWLTTSAAVFLLSQIVSTLFSIDRHTSLWGYYGRFNGGLVSIIAYLILMMALVNVFDVGKLLKLLRFSLLTSVLVMAWGLPGKLGYDLSCLVFTAQFNNSCWTDQFRPAERMFSTLGQPNWLGAYLAIHFFIALFFYVSEVLKNVAQKSAVRQWSILLYLLLNFMCILFTRSRSALLSVGIGLLVALAYYGYIRWQASTLDWKLPAIIYLVAGLSAVTIIFQTGIPSVDKLLRPGLAPTAIPASPQLQRGEPAQTQPVLSVPANKSDAQVDTGVTDSFEIRKIVWSGAIELGKRYPLFGTGVETFAYAYYFVRPASHNLTSEWDYLYNKAHNEFLNYLATTGFVGLSAYLFLIASTYIIGSLILLKERPPKERDRPQYFLNLMETRLLVIVLLAAYTTIHVTNFLGFSTTTVNLFFYMIPAMLVLIERTYLPKQPVAKTQPTGLKLTLLQQSLVVTSCIGFGLVIIYVVLYFVADLKYAQAEAYAQSSDYQSAAAVLQDGLKLHYEHVYEDKLSNTLANLSYLAAYQKNKDLAQQFHEASDYYNKKAIAASPKNVLYWKTRAKNNYLYYEATTDGQYLRESLAALAQAQTLSPTDSKLHYSSALFYSTMSEEEKNTDTKQQEQSFALAEINQSIALKPNYRDAYVLKGQLLKKYGNKAEARRVFQFILDHFDPHDADAAKEMKDL